MGYYKIIMSEEYREETAPARPTRANIKQIADLYIARSEGPDDLALRDLCDLARGQEPEAGGKQTGWVPEDYKTLLKELVDSDPNLQQRIVDADKVVAAYQEARKDRFKQIVSDLIGGNTEAAIEYLKDAHTNKDEFYRAVAEVCNNDATKTAVVLGRIIGVFLEEDAARAELDL
jgi:hypothetical protein